MRGTLIDTELPVDALTRAAMTPGACSAASKRGKQQRRLPVRTSYTSKSTVTGAWSLQRSGWLGARSTVAFTARSARPGVQAR